MQTYYAPGVYIEEEFSAPMPVEGVSTAGFIGLVADDVTMPVIPGEFDEGGQPIKYTIASVGAAELITTWPEFKNTYGDIQSGNKILAEAVFGFFNNGGTRCWVARVTDLRKTAAAGGNPATDSVKDALDAFEEIAEIAIVAAPMPSDVGYRDGAGNADTAKNLSRRADIRQKLLIHCEKMTDRMAILDGEETVSGNLVPEVIYPNASGNAKGASSDFGAIYFPWIDISGTGDFIPPSGHIAGIYARSEAQVGVHKAPANEVIMGALDLAVDLSNAQQGSLNKAGINCLRAFPGRGLRVWGARTLSQDPEWTYVSTRRIFLAAGRWIERNMAGIVFEPNDADLWERIRLQLTVYFNNQFQRGALKGSSAGEAFFVKCDAETNPAEVRKLGQVVTVIGLATAVPSEFICVRIIHGRGGVTIDEPAGSDQ